MKVSHINHLDTHAIIGGGEAMAFETSNSAEFFEILSSTLYSNKKLAVIREVLIGNAWDAHLAVGKDHIPVEVTLSDSELIVRDFGPGIPKDKMVSVYCTYGNSTKLHDGKQTGGFGLGSKAPFAYAKNFSVTSFSEGFKTIYNISRGTSATNGVPDIRAMVSVPTTETGLMVTIPINPTDKAEFEELINDLTFMGGIHVKLNGSKLRRLNYGKVKDDLGFMLTSSNALPRHLQDNSDYFSYFLKYGSVVYPVSNEFINKHGGVSTIGPSRITVNNTRQLAVILLAEPNSVGITPSRESLEYTDKTEATLKALLQKVNNTYKELYPKAVEELTAQYEERLDVTRLLDSYSGHHRTTVLASFYKNARTFYERIVDATHLNSYDYAVQGKQEYNCKEDIMKLLILQFVKRNACKNEVVNALLNKDPQGLLFREKLKVALVSSNKIFSKQILHAANNDQNITEVVSTELKKLNYKFYKLMKYVETSFGANTSIRIRHNSDLNKDFFFEAARRKTSRNTIRKDTVLLDLNITALNTLPVVIFTSEASLQRFNKRNSTNGGGHKNGLYVLIRKKADLTKAKEYFTNILKFKNVTYLPDVDYIEKAITQLPQLYLLGWDSKHNYRTVTPHTNEKVEFYIFATESYMLPCTSTYSSNSKSLNLSSNVVQSLVYLYPNLVICSSIAEAKLFESVGLVNVFKNLADEVVKYIENPDVFEVVLQNIDGYSGFISNYYVSTALQYLSLGQLLEAFDKAPKYIDKEVVPSTVFSVFSEITGRSFAPKYGLQYLQKAATIIGDRFSAYVGEEVTKVMRHNAMHDILNTFSGYRQKKEKAEFNVIGSALMSAIQTVRLQMHLEKMENKNE